MVQEKENLCPFSKAIIGKFCQCPHASLLERCSGKMLCTEAEDHLQECESLVKVLVYNSRFIFSVTDTSLPLTHQNMMKIKCGGLIGINRVICSKEQIKPSVIKTKSLIKHEYGSFDKFPFGQIIRDISTFKVRNKRKKPK